MKKIHVFLLIFGVLGWFTACEDTKEKAGNTSTEDTVKVLEANWEADSLQRLVNRYYIENAFKKGKMYLNITDKLTGKTHNVRLVGFEDTVYRTSKESGYITAKMQAYHIEDKGDTLKVDYQVIWKLERGKYELGAPHIRKYANDERYFWQKRDDYYERISPQERQGQAEEAAINS